MSRRIGIIGCGTIGSHIAEGAVADPDMELVFVLEPDDGRVRPYESCRVDSIKSASRHDCDVVVECANPEVLKELAGKVLSFSDLMVLSITAFSDDGFREEVSALCEKYHRRVFLPHGAVLGLDGILDGRQVIDSVQVETTKRPENLGCSDVQRTELYRGPARRACELFPRNVNVHAVVAMCGVGFDETTSVIIADPAAEGNSHTIRIHGEEFRFCIEVVSLPGGEVSSSYTPESALNSLRRALARPYGFTFL